MHYHFKQKHIVAKLQLQKKKTTEIELEKNKGFKKTRSIFINERLENDLKLQCSRHRGNE